jgi:phage shock protein PspC (stress-responsive transcriptional regulator)
MNKTVNINLGGIFFHIDEDAFQKLSRYFDAIKRSLSNSGSQDEIIKDIEIRIAELVSEKHTHDKQVISLAELDEIIAIMGQPNDYKIDDESENSNDFNVASPTYSTRKKLYRDKDGAMIGGVISGLGYYFGIDKVWLRILFLVGLFFFGSGVLAYIILWIVIPEAKTTSEKLEMMGQPVTISNIEKKVKEEFESVSDKFKNVDYNKVGDQVKNGTEKLGNTLGDIILSIFRVVSIIFGISLIVTSITFLILLLIGVFTLGTNSFFGFPWHGFLELEYLTDYPLWSIGLLIFFIFGIPFFFLLFLGFKLILPKMKSIGSITSYTLLAVWFVCVSLAVTLGIKQLSAFSSNGRIVNKQDINIPVTDTLQIKFRNNDFYTNNENDNSNFMITLDSTGNQIIYSKNISFRIVKTDSKVPYLQLEKEAKGKTLAEAKERAEKINYGYQVIGNQIVLDNYFVTAIDNKFRDQQVEIILYLPEGYLFKTDSSVQEFDESDNEYFNLHFSSDDYLYKVTGEKVKCLNCPIEENEYNDIDVDTTITTTIKINGETIIENEKPINKGLSIDEEGKIIKNK